MLTHHCHIRDSTQLTGLGAKLLSERSAELWLEYMNDSLLEMENEINDIISNKLMDYFRFTAYFLVVSVEEMKRSEVRRTYDNDTKNLIS